jgi:hypothetical protein
MKLNLAFLQRGLVTAAMTCTVWGAAVPAHAIAIEDAFYNSVEPDWTLIGNAELTAGGIDDEGKGWLRLTKNENWQHGTAVYNKSFPATEGVRITFDYVAYGNTNGGPADGISFYLIDGAVTPTLGAGGGALGYSITPNWAATGAQPGVTGGLCRHRVGCVWQFFSPRLW